MAAASRVDESKESQLDGLQGNHQVIMSTIIENFFENQPY